MKKQKLKLSELAVDSFVMELGANTQSAIIGGSTSYTSMCGTGPTTPTPPPTGTSTTVTMYNTTCTPTVPVYTGGVTATWVYHCSSQSTVYAPPASGGQPVCTTC